MDFEKITITLLTERAGINRKTFYLHYASLNELLNELIDEIADSYIQTVKYKDGLRDMSEIVFLFLDFLVHQDRLREQILCSRNYRYISDRINRRITSEIQFHYAYLKDSEACIKNILISYLNASALEMYRRWVMDKKKLPRKDFLSLAGQLISHGILSIPGYLSGNTDPKNH